MKLIKPPSIMDDIVSQQSENFTHKTNNRSLSGKRGRKQNTIKIGANLQEHSVHSREHDNDSVHSHASGRSKGKKTKETTLPKPKITQSPKIQREEDSHSVHSNGSKHSHKSVKKQNTIMQKPKIEGHKKYQSPIEPSSNSKVPSFKDAWNNLEEESIINQYDRVDSKEASPQNPAMKKRQHKENKPSNAKFAPFADIQHHGSDDEPVIKLQEPADVYNKNAIIVGGHRPEERLKRQEQSRADIQESNVIFGESKIRASKSRRRNIFDKSIQDSSSRVTNSIAQSSISGLENTTKRSSSRRREIFNSRQRKDREDSRDNKESRTDMIKIGQVPLQSKEIQRSNFKPAAHQNDRLVQIPKKVTDHNEDDFSLDQSKSELNLSTSNNMGKGDYKDRDSLIFQFEPEKKKGMTVASKDTKKSGRVTQPLHAKNDSSDRLPAIGNTLVSKEVSEQLKTVQQLLRANDQYLKKNQYLNANMKKKSSEGPGLFTLDDSDEEKLAQKPWHEIVNDIQKQDIIPIKTVQRNQTPLNQAKLEKEKVQKLKRQQQQQARKDRQIRQRQQQQERQRKKQIERENRKRKQREQRQRRQKKQQQERQRQQRQQRQRQEQQERERKEKKEKDRLLRQQRKRKQRQQRQKEEAEQEQRQMRQAEKRQAQIFEKERIEKQKRKIERKKREQEQARRKQQQQKIREEELQQQRIQMKKRKEKNKAAEEEMPKITPIVSTFARQQSDTKSQKSNKSSKKANKKKQTTLGRPKIHKAYVKTQSPRAEESFYDSNASGEQSKKQQFPEVKKQEKKPKLLNFSDDEEQMKPKAKTDMNFFDHSQSQKSFKPPSSKPPLSKRTNGSVGGSSSKQKRPKENTIAINVKNKQTSGKSNNVSHPKGQKKLTLMERAMMKHNQSNDSGSDASCRDFSSDGSRRSNSSKQSRGSIKKQSTLQLNQMIHSKQGKKLVKRKSSNASSHEDQLQTIERRRAYEEDRERSKQRVNKMKSDIINERMIVSKNCTFIDERGRLVQKDLIIKGRDVYGAPGYDCSDQSVLNRMRRSREDHRKRSTSRDKNKLSRKLSRQSSDNGSNEGVSYASSNTFYENSGYYANNTVNNPLRQFIRPVEQVPNYNKQQLKKNESGYNEGKTLNQMFGKKAPVKAVQQNPSMTMTLSGSRSSRRSLGRTEKSNSKRM